MKELAYSHTLQQDQEHRLKMREVGKTNKQTKKRTTFTALKCSVIYQGEMQMNATKQNFPIKQRGKPTMSISDIMMSLEQHHLVSVFKNIF